MSKTTKIETLGQESLTDEAVRLADFQETLSSVPIKPMTTTPDLDLPNPADSAKEEFFGSDYQSGPTFYVVPELAKDIAEGLIGFEPFVLSGRKRSRHGVFFGAFEFEDGTEMPVAIKPHFTNEDDVQSRREGEASCLRDYFTNLAVSEAGFETLEPVGVILDGKYGPYSITLLDDTLKTLDTIDWTNFFRPGFENSGMTDILYKLSQVTAALHDSSIPGRMSRSYHGDLSLGNVANNIFGQLFMIDWEDGNISNCPTDDVEERFGKTWIDIKGIMLSMVKPTKSSDAGVEMFKECEGDWWLNFKEVFLDDYIEHRKALAALGSHHMHKLKDTESELAQLEHSLEAEMRRWEKAAKTGLRVI